MRRCKIMTGFLGVLALGLIVRLVPAEALTLADTEAQAALGANGLALEGDEIRDSTGVLDELVWLSPAPATTRLVRDEKVLASGLAAGVITGVRPSLSRPLAWGTVAEEGFLMATDGTTTWVARMSGRVRTAAWQGSTVMAVVQGTAGDELVRWDEAGVERERTELGSADALWCFGGGMLYGVHASASGMMLETIALPLVTVTTLSLATGVATPLALDAQGGTIVILYQGASGSREVEITGSAVALPCATRMPSALEAVGSGERAYANGTCLSIETEGGEIRTTTLASFALSLSYVSGCLAVRETQGTALYSADLGTSLSFGPEEWPVGYHDGLSSVLRIEEGDIRLETTLSVRTDDVTFTRSDGDYSYHVISLGLEALRGLFPWDEFGETVYGENEALATTTVAGIRYLSLARVVCPLVVNVFTGCTYDVPYVITSNACLKLDGMDVENGVAVAEAGSHVLECADGAGHVQVIGFMARALSPEPVLMVFASALALAGRASAGEKEDITVTREGRFTRTSTRSVLIGTGTLSFLLGLGGVMITGRVRRKRHDD